MRVEVRLHAELLRYAPDGVGRSSLTLRDGAPVSELLASFAALAERRVVVGVNGELAKPETELREGDVVDLLTPMSGG